MGEEKSIASLRVASKVRRSISLHTTVSHTHTQANPWYGDLSRAGVRKQLEDTLKALKSDSVDVLYLHGPDAKHDIERHSMRSIDTKKEIQTLHSRTSQLGKRCTYIRTCLKRNGLLRLYIKECTTLSQELWSLSCFLA